MPERTKQDGIILIEDGAESGEAQQVVVTCEVGDFNWKAAKPQTVLRDRGAIVGSRAADEDPCSGSLSVNHVQLCSGLPDSEEAALPTLYEIMQALAAASSWLSTSAPGYAKTVRLTLWVLNPDPDGLDEKVVFEKAVLDTFEFAEGDPDTEKFTFQDMETAPTVTRETYTAAA
jgi:hypothetical protein